MICVALLYLIFLCLILFKDILDPDRDVEVLRLATYQLRYGQQFLFLYIIGVRGLPTETSFCVYVYLLFPGTSDVWIGVRLWFWRTGNAKGWGRRPYHLLYIR